MIFPVYRNEVPDYPFSFIRFFGSFWWRSVFLFVGSQRHGHGYERIKKRYVSHQPPTVGGRCWIWGGIHAYNTMKWIIIEIVYDRVRTMFTTRENEMRVSRERKRGYKGPATFTFEIYHQPLLFKKNDRHTSQRQLSGIRQVHAYLISTVLRGTGGTYKLIIPDIFSPRDEWLPAILSFSSPGFGDGRIGHYH